MRKYDYVRDGTPEVDEAPAYTLTNKLAALERETSAAFWETQAEMIVPEYREEMRRFNVNFDRDHFLDVGTRKAVWGFVNCFTPGFLSMH
jgi:arginyl-tRNA synthetase